MPHGECRTHLRLIGVERIACGTHERERESSAAAWLRSHDGTSWDLMGSGNFPIESLPYIKTWWVP